MSQKAKGCTPSTALMQRLHQASRAIAAASDEAAVGQALMDFVASGDLHAARLLFLIDVVDGQPTTIEMREGWTADDRPAQPHGTRLPLKDFPLLEFLQADNVITFEDVQNDERANESVRMMMTLSGLRSFAVIPITTQRRELEDNSTKAPLTEDQVVTFGRAWLGALIIGRNGVSSFDDELIYTLWTLADQAASIIENIRLFAQTQATLSESAMLYDASRRLTSADSLNEMLSIVAASARIPAINRVAFWTLERDADGEVIAIVQEADWHSGEGKRPLPWMSRFTLDERPSAKFMLSTEPTLVRNTQTNKYMDSVTKEAFKQQNICAMAMLPLWVGKHQLGTLMLVGEQPHYFTENEIRPYRSLAGQMAVLLENRQLLEQTQAALAESEMLYDTSRRLTSASDLQGMVSAIAEGARVPAINRAALWIIEHSPADQETVFVLAASWRSSEETPALPLGTRFPLSLFPAIRMAQGKEAAFVDDILNDKRIDPMTQAVFQQQNARSVALLPLWAGERQSGTLMLLGNEPHHFSESEIRPYRLLSSQMAVRVENRRLLEQTQQAAARFRDVALSSGNWVWEIDTQSRYSYCSERVADLLGYSPAEILGKMPAELMPPAEAERVSNIIFEIMSAKQPMVELEYRNLTQDGREIVLRTDAVPILDQDENLLGYRGVSRDITAQKQAENERERLLAALERRSNQLQTAAEVSQAASSILGLDELIQQVVDLVRERFDLYYAGLFLVEQTDDPGEWAVLQADTGEIGVERGEKLQVGGDSLIGWCIANKKARVSLDMSNDTVRFDHPLLPETRSEMALPLISWGQAIGAMTIHSAQEDAFSNEDIAVFQTMADQLAAAIDNARLYDAAQARAEQERLVRTITDRIRRGANREAIMRTTLQELGHMLGASQAIIRLGTPDQLCSNPDRSNGV